MSGTRFLKSSVCIVIIVTCTRGRPVAILVLRVGPWHTGAARKYRRLDSVRQQLSSRRDFFVPYRRSPSYNVLAPKPSVELTDKDNAAFNTDSTSVRKNRVKISIFFLLKPTAKPDRLCRAVAENLQQSNPTGAPSSTYLLV